MTTSIGRFLGDRGEPEPAPEPAPRPSSSAGTDAYQPGEWRLLTGMRTFPRRRTARRSHHPAVTCDALGRWHWQCGCGAGARAGSDQSDWHWMVTAALVHQSTCPGE